MKRTALLFLILSLSCSQQLSQQEKLLQTFDSDIEGTEWWVIPLIFGIIHSPVEPDFPPIPDFPDPGPRGTPCILREDHAIAPGELIYDGGFVNESGQQKDIYRTPEVPFDIGPDTPSVIVYARQDRSLDELGGGDRMSFTTIDPRGDEFDNGSYGGYTYGVQHMPRFKDPTLAGFEDNYPAYETRETYQIRFRSTGEEAREITTLRSCTPLSEEEKNFQPDLRRIDYRNGMDHEWVGYRHLNVHIILIHGEDHRPLPEDIQFSLDYLSAMYAQPTTKMLLHYTFAIVEDETLLDPTDSKRQKTKEYEDAELPVSTAYIFSRTKAFQKEDAINVYLLRDNPSSGGAIGGVLPTMNEHFSVAPLREGKLSGVFIHLNSLNLQREIILRELGYVMGHEIGHGLGLYHFNWDLLIETPICDWDGVRLCGTDFYYADNTRHMMGFPYGDETYQEEPIMWITGEQAYVMRLHPLSYR